MNASPLGFSYHLLLMVLLIALTTSSRGLSNVTGPINVEQSLPPLLEFQELLASWQADSFSRYALRSVSLDFGLSASGVLAPLLVGGNRAVSLEWSGLQNGSEVERLRNQQKSNWNGSLKSWRDLGGIVKSVQNRKKLVTFLRRFRAACEEIQATPPTNWRIGEFTATESFEAEAGIPGALKMGSRVHLALSWKPALGASELRAAPRSAGFSQMLKFMIQDLTEVSATKMNSDFEITTFKIGVGEGKAFDFFLGKVGHGFRGMVSFVKETEPSDEHSPASGSGEYLFSLSDLGQKMTGIRRDRFRKGLSDALSMSSNVFRLVHRASLPASSWQVNSILVSFDVLSHGKWYLPWVQKKAFSEVVFQRRNRTKRQEAGGSLLCHTLTIEPMISFGLPGTLHFSVAPLLGMKWFDSAGSEEDRQM